MGRNTINLMNAAVALSLNTLAYRFFMVNERYERPEPPWRSRILF
jgi:hypothetical protein